MDRVLIRGLAVDCVVGILAEERVRLQPLRFDLTMTTDFAATAGEGGEDRIVCYARVSELVRGLALRGEYRLLETMAEDICNEIFRDFDVTEIDLTIEKPEAVAEAAWVGIQVRRYRP